MRDFGETIGTETREEITKLAQSIFDRVETKRAVPAGDFAIEEEPERIVVHEVDLRGEEGRLRIAVTAPDARPPFEWLLEITDDLGETDYFKHYLIREDDIVLAQRKVLTPIDEAEAQVILADLRLVEGWL